MYASKKMRQSAAPDYGPSNTFKSSVIAGGPINLYRSSSQPPSLGLEHHGNSRKHGSGTKKLSTRGNHRLGKGSLRMGSRGARRKPVILRSQSTNSLKHLAMQFAQDALYTQDDK